MSTDNFKVWTKRIALALCALILLTYLIIQISFRHWRNHQREALLNGSELIKTSHGFIEYASAGKGPAILIMHGAPGGYDQSILFQGFRTITPSRPGYLRTDLSVGRSYEEATEAYSVLLDSIGIDSVAVIGISAGGPPALHFAMQFPDRVWGLVLISAITKDFVLPIPEPGQFRKVTDKVFGKDFADWILIKAINLFPEELILNQENDFISPSDQEILRQDPEKLQFFLNWIESMSGAFSKRLGGYINDRRQYPKTGIPDPIPITIPTLVIHGTSDKDVGYEHAELAVRRITGAELVPIEDAGHLILLTHHETVMPLIDQFLKDNCSTVSY